MLNDEGDFIGFDIVIGNPPYILVQNLGDKRLFEYYNNFYLTATYKIDTYALFYELGFKLLRNNFYLCYISPNTFLKNKHAKQLRSLILNNSIHEIINFYIPVFNDAAVDTLILQISKSYQKNNNFNFAPYYYYTEDLYSITKVKHKQQDFQIGNLEIELDIDTSLRKLFLKMENNSKPLSFFGRAYFGIQTFDRKKHVSSIRKNDNYYPVLDGTNIKRYYYLPNNEFVQFEKEAIKSGGNPEVYNKNRIIVRQIGIFPEGTIIQSGLMTLNTVYNIFLYKEDVNFLKYILGLLNSKLFNFYWTKKYYDNKSTFPKIKKIPLESLPINISNGIKISIISNLVDQILSIKKSNFNSDTKFLEKEINQIIYEIYELTEEEIQIIEETMQ